MSLQKQEAKNYQLHEALNASGIKQLQFTPAHYLAYRRGIFEEQGTVQSPALRKGSAVDNLLLDPVEDRRIAVYKPAQKLKKDGTPAANTPSSLDSEGGLAFVQENPGKICLAMKEYEEVRHQVECLKKNPVVQRYITGGSPKVQIFLDLEAPCGLMIPVKCEIDYLTDEYIIDLKTTAESATKFYWAFSKYSYDIQAAWYQKLSKAYDGRDRKVIFIAAEKFDPYEVKALTPAQERIEAANVKCEYAMDVYANCLNSGEWPGYDTEIEEF